MDKELGGFAGSAAGKNKPLFNKPTLLHPCPFLEGLVHRGVHVGTITVPEGLADYLGPRGAKWSGSGPGGIRLGG